MSRIWYFLKKLMIIWLWNLFVFGYNFELTCWHEGCSGTSWYLSPWDTMGDPHICDSLGTRWPWQMAPCGQQWCKSCKRWKEASEKNKPPVGRWWPRKVRLPAMCHSSVYTDIVIFHSSRPSDEYIHQWTRPSLVQIMAWHQIGAKPLSEPMLEYCLFEP